jgi:hypothetical protein
MFFIQRCFIVLIVAAKLDFGLQWGLTQVILVLNTVYLFAVRPYWDMHDGVTDYFNNVGLILLSIV